MTAPASSTLVSARLRLSFGSLFIAIAATTAGAQTPRSLPAPEGSTLDTGHAAEARSPYLGSASVEARQPAVIELSLAQALDRAMRVNLGLLFDRTASDTARAARRDAIAALMPHVNAALGESTRRINPRALGIPLRSLPGTADVNNSDVRVSIVQSLFDPEAIAHVRSAGASQRAAQHGYGDGRETVAVVVAGAYLSVATAKSHLDHAQADLDTATALLQLARDREDAGLSPEVDTLRAQVEQQARQESVIDATNELARRRIVLLRLLGLDLHQEIRLVDGPTDRASETVDGEKAYGQALQSREDYRAAQEQVRAAELAKRAAQLARAPHVVATGDYGALGTTPGNAVPTWSAGIALEVPIFDGGRISAGVATADSTLRQRRAALEDVRARIAQDVETALLDLESARQQVEVSRSAVGYARRALQQSRDRFASGVTNNIEVVQAQEALARANDRWVASLHEWNIARVLLARATGTAEESVRTLLAPIASHASSRPS